MNIMQNIRKGMWETNSSSTHAICIKNMDWQDIIVPDIDTLHFGFGEYGWEWEKLSSIQDKANYLWTAIYQLSDQRLLQTNVTEWKDYIKQVLKSVNVEAYFEDIRLNRLWEVGYIDHAGELLEWLLQLSSDSAMLLSFLFNSESCIYTGNDNEENDMWDTEVDNIVDYTIYMKGN